MPDTLEKVLLNLLSNAVKYTSAGGKVELSAVAEGDQGVIEVRDSGIGIPADQQGKIFQRYQRVLEKESERVAGAGIGLALVRELVEAHDGTVELESEPGRGSRFTVRLPLEIAPGAGAFPEPDFRVIGTRFLGTRTLRT